MAKRGEIDPWNIDIVELADKFLKKVEDLRFSARVLLYAAILLRMKAEVLVSEAIVEEVEENVEEDLEVVQDVSLSELPLELERPMDVQSQSKRPKRYTTLQELIRELRKAEKIATRKRRTRRRIERDVQDVMKVPHEEDIEETIAKVYEDISRMFELNSVLSFFELTRGFDSGRTVSYYVSILHLAYRGKLRIEQERFYEDIKIIPPS